MRLIHIALFAASASAAYGLGLALSPDGLELQGMLVFVAALTAAKTLSFELFRLHRSSWRWFGLPDAAALTVANTSGSVLAALALGPRVVVTPPAAVLLIEWLVSQGFLLGSRLLFRALVEIPQRRTEPARKRVLIYGAGRRGLNRLRQIRGNPQTRYEVFGFIDDDPANRHLMLQMTPVLGTGDELPRLARLHQIDEVLVAIGSLSREDWFRMSELSRFAGIPCRFPPRLSRRKGRPKATLRSGAIAKVDGVTEPHP